MTKPGIVIIGGGQAGAQAAISLRENKYSGSINLICDEIDLPYLRPPLSKKFLASDGDQSSIRIRQEHFYRENLIDVATNTRAVGIDRNTKTVRLSDGRYVHYSQLVLATGARNRELKIEGTQLEGVFYLRTLPDAIRLREWMKAANRVVVIGAGFIGLEFASVASKFAQSVTVIENASRVMARSVSEIVSAHFEKQHIRRGVVFRFNEGAQAIHGIDGKVTSVETSTGQIVPADLVLIAVGIIPNSELAEVSGLHVDNGIVVNDYLATQDASIFAIGDCAAYPNAFAETRVRLESVQNAVDQAKSIASLITGTRKPFRSVPWFWSDQANDKLQIAGITRSTDERILLGEEASGKFSVLSFGDGRLKAVESVNNAADHVAARKILMAGKTVRRDEVTRGATAKLATFC